MKASINVKLPALFIGRFQPFHKGHLDAIRQILAKHGKIIIGIGSAQYVGGRENPFSAEMREKMITKSLLAEKIPPKKFIIVKIPDIHDDNKWVQHVEKLAPKFGPVYSGTPKVQKLFRAHGAHPITVQNFNLPISGTSVRRKMAYGGLWKSLVPTAVKKLINRA